MDLVTNTTEAINMTNSVIHCPSNQNFEPLILHILVIIEVIVGLPGNMVALWIFCICIKCWKPHTLLLFNLALADLLLLISVPFRIHTALQGDHWVFGQVLCRVNLFMLAVNRAASIAFMTVVALNRYFKVVHPHHWISRMSLTQACWTAGLMWTVVIAVRFPLLTTNLLLQHGNVSLCRSFNAYSVVPLPLKIHYVAFVAEFFLSWFLILYCSAHIACFLHKQQRDTQKKVRKAIQAVGVISLVFTICFLPSILTGLGALCVQYFHPTNCTSYNLITQLFMICLGFTYLNSALDPLIYSFSSSMFQDALKSSISCLSLKKKNVRPVNNQ
ncbi:hydroxycarboxylic acid receptor 2-like [Plectropomus leopardus]|uniref:hydroxycarboxylic acid receptor 2-like n=1 Tax=Plectropomus leopardus TaxID=160734 RepID=UPI001C4C40E3|nr:hydroxycarboxylic acid receptor 2-like [Plectropomus leopardus]